MLNATVDVRRALERMRIDPNRGWIRATSLPRHGFAVARFVRRRLTPIVASLIASPSPTARPIRAQRWGAHPLGHPAGAHPAGALEWLFGTLRPARLRSRLRPILGTHLARERVLPVGVAGLVLAASVVSVTPGGAVSGTGNTEGPGDEPRLAIGALSDRYGEMELEIAPPEADLPGGFVDAPIDGGPIDEQAQPGDDLTAIESAGTGPGALPDGQPPLNAQDPLASPAPDGPYLADGTLLKPVAVDTTVPDSKDKLRTYRVKSGDTLVGIADNFGVSMMTLWWANDLSSKNDLHVGQTLVVPPVSGLVVNVKDGDTLESLASATGVTADEILEYNGLEDRNLIIGQTLIVPGARGEAIPTPKPTPASRSTSGGSGGGSSGGGSSSARPPTRYTGGAFAWPTGGGYISQYFHYGHYGIDIAGDYGTSIRAAAAGTVVFSGWKGNGGGYQVWVAHGSGLYTTYNHMSSLSVGAGERVGRGQSIGRMGSTGRSTGSHLHFEVWRGPIWNGGRRVNPFIYL